MEKGKGNVNGFKSKEMNYTIKIWNINSKGKEKIIELKTFDNRLDAENFITEYKAELKPYKMLPKTTTYTMQL